ncbi:MAG: flagellar basal body-associated FliL family protein [Bacteriovoracaceae bacterium]|nr:flagellar basal body-associated FliL family protein [Bacteriovoracaceae bacterium]
MNKWLKIEELINSFISNFLSLLSGKAKSLTPQKIKKKYQTSKELLTSRRGDLKEKLNQKKVKALTKVLSTKEQLDKAKQKTINVVHKAKETDIKSIKWTRILATFGVLLAPPLLKLKSWYINLQPTQIASFVTLSTVATLASVNIYVQSNKIAEESRSPASEIAEEVDKATAISRRPAYFKRTEKQFKVSNVVLPAYVKSNGAVRKLVIDFTFESSNKYIKEYLWQNTNYIHDVLNSKIEPISIEFPLEEEGKIIVKEKILREMNDLLKRLKIKGEIKEVYIDSMIAG